MKHPIPNGYIVSPYGLRIRNGIEEFHHGIDISTKETPALIYAPCQMIAIIAGWSNSFGNRIWVKLLEGEHKNKYMVFAHMQKLNKQISPNFKLNKGDLIGWMGSTGLSSLPHLHQEIRLLPTLGSKSFDCASYIY